MRDCRVSHTLVEMVRQLVVGNWKMNGSLADNRVLVAALTAALGDGAEVAICVPFPYLSQVSGLLQASNIVLGAQDVSAHSEGAYTGQVSARMLREFDCAYVIVGHSERRAMLRESDAEVADKTIAALAAGLTPIVCVGETLAERDAGSVQDVIGRQLGALEAVDASRVVIAYEPVWAIGTGRSAQPAQVAEVLGFIRDWLRARTDKAHATRILYGGSVKADTAAELFALPDCDGGLIGGASLVAEEFITICRAAADRST